MGIKDVIKKKCNSGKRIDSENLYELVKAFEYVSFDIFDTLVKRNTAEPADIFLIMEKTVGVGFKSKRIEAERRARSESGKKEVNLEDIYLYFSQEKRKELIQLEIETELKAIVPNYPLQEVYKKCLDNGKTIYITSDTYWSEETIVVLLEKNGFTGYKKLYISSTQQKLKSDGSLFRQLLEEENIKAKDIAHIGDSIKGDYEKPQKLGIKAIRIPRYFKNIEFRGDDKNYSIELNYLNHFINNTFSYTEDYYYQFGYSQFGKLLYGYAHWIHDAAIKRGIKKIFFFARDGYIMKKAYETCVKDSFIETRYLEVSRRSLRGAILWMDCSYETILNMVINAKLVSLESIFDGIGLEVEKYKEVINSYKLAVTEIFDRSKIRTDERLKSLIESIKSDIIDNSKKEYSLLCRYLIENNVQGRFAVVDIGYAGSMQRYLQQILTYLEIEHDITGLYFAVADFYTKNMLSGVKLDLNGYLFDFQHDLKAVDTRRSFVGLFETLFLEQDGSVKKYVTDDKGKVIADRYPYEYEVGGKPTEDLKKIRNIQTGAIDFVKSAANDEMLEKLRCNPDEYFVGLRSLGESPSMKELKFFGDILFYDEGMTERLASPKSIIFYAFHPKHMKEEFLKCRWKTGFLKRLFKVKLPYQKIYEKLRSMMQEK